MHSKTDFFIDGAWVKAHSDQALSVINPTTEEVIETISLGNETDLNLAVAAARATSTGIRTRLDQSLSQWSSRCPATD